MNQVIIIIGLPGSGKATWARKNYPDAHFIDGLPPEETMKALISTIDEYSYIVDHGDVVLDSNAFTVHSIAGYVQVAKAFGYEVKMVMLRTPEPKKGTNESALRLGQQWTLNKLLNDWPTIWGDLHVESVK